MKKKWNKARVKTREKRLSFLAALCFAIFVALTATGCETQMVEQPEVSQAVETAAETIEESTAPTPTPTPIPTPTPTPSPSPTPDPVDLSAVPAYSGKPFVALGDNVPDFGADKTQSTSFESYSPLDDLGGAGFAFPASGRS